MKEYKRPTTLYRYAKQTVLERALLLGEFQVQPTLGFQEERPVSASIAPTTLSFLTLGFAQEWDKRLFTQHPESDACLVIHKTEEFGELLHRAVQSVLPDWTGIDSAMSYGRQSPLGSVFTKPLSAAKEQEWQFAWRPVRPMAMVTPVVVTLGSIERFAEIRKKDIAQEKAAN
jgi:hypothetical protein